MAVKQRPAPGARGQHFLRSSRLAAELVRAAGVAPGDVVVDIGAGTGVLTRALLDRGASVIAVELDPTLARALERRYAGDGVAVVCVDAARFVWPSREFSVVSNLPFAGSTSILSRLLQDPGVPLTRAVLILQWELAVKHAAVWPATLKGTYWRTWNELTITDRLARNAFTPAPNVDAAVLRIEPRPEPMLEPHVHATYWRFLSGAFGARGPLNRTMRSLLSRMELRRLGDALGFPAEAHARDLDVRQWAAVFTRVQSRRG